MKNHLVKCQDANQTDEILVSFKIGVQLFTSLLADLRQDIPTDYLLI